MKDQFEKSLRVGDVDEEPGTKKTKRSLRTSTKGATSSRKKIKPAN
jgi:hypothetical protein